jgi:hypothetical protein
MNAELRALQLQFMLQKLHIVPNARMPLGITSTTGLSRIWRTFVETGHATTHHRWRYILLDHIALRLNGMGPLVELLSERIPVLATFVVLKNGSGVGIILQHLQLFEQDYSSDM